MTKAITLLLMKKKKAVEVTTAKSFLQLRNVIENSNAELPKPRQRTEQQVRVKVAK